MPKQSHRTTAKKKGKRKHQPITQQRQVSSVQEGSQTSTEAITAPIGPSRKQPQRSIENPYVAGELKKIGVMAGTVFAVYLVLWVVLPHILG
jgi:hypothetical protein